MKYYDIFETYMYIRIAKCKKPAAIARHQPSEIRGGGYERYRIQIRGWCSI